MKLDKTEMKILIELQKDGRLSRRMLADRIDVSTPTVSSKIEKLENMGIIEGFRVEIDHRKLGFQKYFFKIESEGKTEEEIREVFAGSERLRQIEKLEGSGFLLTLFINDFSQLDKATEYLEKEDGIKIKEVWRTQDEESKIPNIPLDENVPLDITCYYCNKPIKGEPEKWKKDGKEHYFCCSSCADLYEEKYEKIKEKWSGE
ncbi:MAG: winged helix-turn-helix transcriptional regulator [Candidatus Thermoplasmatota archaeon]|nr:winged helix-turn-helix transcriptional regulator [Candidatus Thermoplasmatota archaeon]